MEERGKLKTGECFIDGTYAWAKRGARLQLSGTLHVRTGV